MDFDGLSNLNKVVNRHTPFLAASIIPFNPYIKQIVRSIARLFGADEVNIDDIVSKIEADPDPLSKLSKVELIHSKYLYAFNNNDKKNARRREKDKITLLGREDWILDFIALTVVLGFFIMCFVVALQRLNQSNHDILYLLIGQLTASFVMVVSYYFGSSNK